jgi:hypothetical protein
MAYANTIIADGKTKPAYARSFNAKAKTIKAEGGT